MNPQIAYEEIAECRLPADLKCVRQALDKLGSYCRARGLRPTAWRHVELAVAEALNNAVEHGCAGKHPTEVSLRWSWHEEILWVEVIDPGDFLPGPGAAKLPENVLAEGGRGAFLMATLMERVEHRRTDRGHLVRMEKTIGFPVWKPGEAAEMEATIESMAEDLSRSYEDLSALFRFAEELATSNTLAEFLDRSLSRLLTLVAGEAAFVRFLSEDGNTLVLIRPPSSNLDWLEDVLALDSDGIEVCAFKKGAPVTVEDCTTHPGDPLHSHVGGAFACPIFFRSTPLGCLVVTRPIAAGYFSAGELRLIRVVADFLGIVHTTNALQKQRRAQERAFRELEIASAIQQSLLPRKFPNTAGYSVFGICQSAQEVGGDYFDALSLPDGGILLVIADVMGKGVPAALLATVLRTAIQARLDLADQPARLLSEVNHQIASDLAQIDMFITAQIAYLSCRENTLLLANAGHCPLILCRNAANQVIQSSESGIPLGVIDGFEYQAERYSIEPGDRLVFITDGTYEVENAALKMLGIDALASHISTLRGSSPVEFCRRVLDFVRDYSSKAEPSDDRTLLTVDRLNSP